MRLRRPAFAKINLGLRVVGVRADGYHELRTVFQTVSLHDTLTFTWPAPAFELCVDDPSLSAGKDNLVRRAAEAFGRAAGVGGAPRVRITLRKRIPMGSGLGGGSSDAAVTLTALNRIHGRPLMPLRLHEIASDLGSDVPFFLTGGTALGLGRGEIVRPLRDLDASPVILLMPRVHLSTPEVFRRADAILTPPHGQTRIYRFSRQGLRGTELAGLAPNDLQDAAAVLHPRLGRLLRELRAAGATVAAMSGSGSAVYGLFAGEGNAARALKTLSRSLPLRSKGTAAADNRARAEADFLDAWLGRTIGGAEYSAKVLS
jgi:4-diphosphocytidyl-2-C-methyl-D-erythritol kinase